MFDPRIGRWPPVFDEESLVAELKKILGTDQFESRFYDHTRTDQPALCQGDILRLPGPAPVIDERGEVAVTEEEFAFWLVLGNSCDNTRDLGEWPWTPIVPLIDLGPMADLNANVQASARNYVAVRRFYVPPWDESVAGRCHMADFTRPVSLHRSAVGAAATVVARMSYFPGWALLHLCLVRFLARGDGRNDP